MKKQFTKLAKIVCGNLFDYAYKITGPINLKEVSSFQNGHFLVQDESSMLASEILAPDIGSKVLDLCAAPGGKTTHLAQLVGKTGLVIARDVSDKKIDLIKSNMEKLGHVLDLVSLRKIQTLSEI